MEVAIADVVAGIVNENDEQIAVHVRRTGDRSGRAVTGVTPQRYDSDIIIVEIKIGQGDLVAAQRTVPRRAVHIIRAGE